uniref:Protein TsetseEP domain-containing protein n=1 Tax=Anopheles coluzzii TaxID=1518534 RepID=A0A8W7PMF4_ANOCL
MAKPCVIAFCVVIALSFSWEVLGEPECMELHQFLKAVETLMVSLPYHTYPVFNLCTSPKAIEDYQNATAFYRNVTQSPICQRYLVQNRMNVYETIYNQLTGLWSSANCEACAGAVNETAEFMRLSTVLDHCIVVHAASPCELCADDYQRVQDFYARLDKAQHGPDRLCFDIADRMNQTRRSWSGTHNCCNDKRRSMVAFASVASVACALPLLFYAVMHVVTVRQEARRLNLLTASSGGSARCEERSQPSGSSVQRPGNGVLRQPEMERIAETDADEEEEEEEELKTQASDGSGSGTAKEDATKTNNLDVKVSNLIDIASPEEEHTMPLPPARTDVSDDESLLQ